MSRINKQLQDYLLWISSSVGRPAKATPAPEKDLDSKILEAVFGSGCATSSKTGSRLSSSSRMSRPANSGICVRCGQACTNLATERVPSKLARGKSVHLTSVNESSSSRGEETYWPTPTAVRYGTSQNESPGDGRTRFAGRGKPSLETMVLKAPLWPTPTASDANSSGAAGYSTENRNSGTTLTDAVVRQAPVVEALWSTPMARDGSHGTTNDRRSLPSDVLWSTPRAHDADAGADVQTANRQGGVSLRTQAGAALNPVWVETLMGFPPGWTEVSEDFSTRNATCTCCSTQYSARKKRCPSCGTSSPSAGLRVEGSRKSRPA